jgi:hypothetical protein
MIMLETTHADVETTAELMANLDTFLELAVLCQLGAILGAACESSQLGEHNYLFVWHLAPL